MKQVIRNQTFETNSSSMHSLCILTKTIERNLEDLKYNVSFGKYGWEHEIYDTPYEIITYLWTAVHYGLIGNDFITLMQEWLPNCVFEQAEVKVDNYGSTPYAYYNMDGYIDHGNEWFDGSIQEIFSSKEMFADVVFNGRIYTSNDNDDYDIYDPDSDDWGVYSDKFVIPGCKKYWVKGN